MSAKRGLRICATFMLCAVGLLALGANIVAPYSYAHQFRDLPSSAPTATHLLGTDTLGRDMFSRLLYGTRVSLLLAPAAALLATLIAGVLGAAAGLLGGWWERSILAITDLSMALPLLFLLIALRAMLPLNVESVVSVVATFLMLGLLGWPSALRVVWAATRNIRQSDFLLLARSSGSGPLRLIFRQVLPNLRPVLLAQFWISIPVFILTEATLSMLGLGVMEPLPSWGNLLRGLEDFPAVSANPWRIAPLVLLILVVICFQLILPSQEDSV
ncbi:MAG TPA: ABC transporter permease [Candidatus Acidoferrum sp.]|nr:ABC transporter permease [Candidatus Acidoferrum sp.]